MSTTAKAREKPILFSGPMVRAILEGRKTQTRRVVKADRHVHSPRHQGPADPASGHLVYHDGGAWDGDVLDQTLGLGWKGRPIATCPYGAPGDRLWVRESAWIAPPNFADVPGDNNARDAGGRGRIVAYAADDHTGETARCAADFGVKLTPSIHMPRWASRITLEIAGIGVERLQSISEADAIAEGFPAAIMSLDGPAYDRAERAWCRQTKADDPDAGMTTARAAFAVGWDTINGKSHPWASDPFVWVVEFRRVDNP